MERPRVLMVDDEVDYLEAMVKVLRKRGVNVVGAESGEKAMDLLEKESIDVTLLDNKMPGMSGMEALKQMKRKWPSMEVIMLTALGSVESGIEGMRMGAFDYVMKPADIDDLVEKIRQAYERRLLLEDKRE
ncbi:MAG: response regulator [Thermodesulfobacteriota bacterium]